MSESYGQRFFSLRTAGRPTRLTRIVTNSRNIFVWRYKTHELRNFVACLQTLYGRASGTRLLWLAYFVDLASIAGASGSVANTGMRQAGASGGGSTSGSRLGASTVSNCTGKALVKS